jgi:uncharacterized protein YcfL
MKQLLVIIASATILASCNSAPKTETPTTDSTTVVTGSDSTLANVDSTKTIDTTSVKSDTTSKVN